MKKNKRIRKAIITIITIALLETSIYAENTISTDKTENQGTNTTQSTNTAAQEQNNTPKEQTPVTTPENTETQEQKQEEKKEETPAEQPKQEQTEPKQQETQVAPAKTQTSQQTYNTSTTTKTQNKVETTKTETTSAKSSIASLSNLGITPHDFSGFKEEKTEYNVTVPNEISEVEIYATKKDSKASIEGTGKVKLQEGDNIEKIVVKAEDGTTKTYTITIQRLKSGEKENVVSNNNSGLGLQKLEIEGAKLEPNFNDKTYQYKVNYEGSATKLKITAQANSNTSNVEIIGNEKLINGQNIVTIVVTDAKEENAVTYQIYVNKNIIDPDEINQQYDETHKQYKMKKIIIIALGITIAMSVIIIMVLLHKKRKYKELDDEHNYKQEYNISKERKSKKGKSGRHSK